MTVTKITGSKTHGILLGQGNYGSTLTITNTGKITGPLYGVYASPRLVGDATINNAGSIRAGTIGIDTPVYGNITNTGNIYGTIAGVYLSSGTLLNQGIIAGKTFALIASGNYNAAKNPAFITNASTGKIIGTDVGVLLRPDIEQQITFINSGTITGHTVGLGVSDNSNYGLGLALPTDAATINNQAGGVISASNGIGVYLSVSSTFEQVTFNNAGAVSGKLFGAYIYNSTFNNAGLVTGNTYGIAIGSGLVTNTGTIVGTEDGISLGTIAATIVNSGTIAGGANAIYGRVALTLGVGEGAVFNGDVIDKSNNGDLILLGTNAATLTGIGSSFQGFSTLAFAPGANGTAEGNIGGLAARETITGFTFGDTLILDGFSATSESITGTGIVLSNGISTQTLNISNAEFYQNFSLSSAAGKTTITFQHINSLITTISTYIPGQVTPGSSYFGSLLTITNTGKVESIYSVFGAPSGTIYNFGTIANITRPTSIDTIHNYGVIIDNGSIYSLSAASLTNAGTIIGLSTFQAGISIGKSFSNTGTIIAENTGIQLSGGHISNSGLIAGQVKFTGGFLYNSGIISSNNTGLSESVFGSYINNTGLIHGTTLGVSVLYSSRSSFTNSGTIVGGATGLQNYGAAITDAGLISGGTFALYNRDHLNGPQYNFTLTLDPGASFSGTVVDATNRGTMVFAGTSAGSIDIGTSFSGFQKFEFSEGSDWTVEGSASLVDGQNIYRFLAGETLILDNFVATSDSFVTGTGLVLSNQTQSETIQLIGNFATENFHVISLAGKTTIVSQATTLTPLSTISTSFNRPIVLNSYYYTNNLSITNTGTIMPPSGGIALSEKFTFSNPTIVNAGLLGEVDINNTGTITNLGTILGTASVYLLEGTVNNFGLISNFGSASSSSKDVSGFVLTVDNYGSIENDAVGISLFSGTVFNSGFISGLSHGIYFENSGNVDNSGTILGGIYSETALNVTISPGSKIAGPVATEHGKLVLAGTTAGSLDIGTTFTGFTNINFDQGATWSLEAGSIAIATGQTINGFTYGDTIILDNFVVNPADTTYVAGTGLELSDTLGNHLTLDITGSFSTSSFLVFDPPGDTTIIPLCYLRGTRIATPAGDVAIEHLNIGDTVITRFSGYRKIKWIGRQSFGPPFIANNFDQIPVRIRQGALAPNTPLRDLFVSPGHAMLIGSQLVLAKNLVNGITILQSPPIEDVHYYQLEFETHDCVLAEGAWSESYADTPDWREKFHNAHEFHALFPNHIAPREQILCAARPLAGPDLEALLSPLAAQATSLSLPGRLHGFIDEMSSYGNIQGWAWDEANPHLPVRLEILAAGRRLGTSLACQPRADLQAAGYAQGHCGFSFTSPVGLPGDPTQLQIRRLGDGATIHLIKRRAA